MAANPPSASSPPTTRLRLSPIHTFIFLYFEPLAALSGSFLLYFQPAKFLTTMQPTLKPSPGHAVIYAQLSATYVLFALNELVLLRLALKRLQAADALLVWRCVLAIILVCDAYHLWGSYVALGSGVFWDVRAWRWEDWVNLGSLWGQGAVRVAFLAGVGVRSVGVDAGPGGKQTKSRKKIT